MQATAQALAEGTTAAAEPGSDYESYGHIVDLSVDLDASPAPTPPGNFIKDPLRRSNNANTAKVRGRQTPPGAAPLRTQHVSISISRSELQQGGIIRLVVDLKLEP